MLRLVGDDSESEWEVRKLTLGQNNQSVQYRDDRAVGPDHARQREREKLAKRDAGHTVPTPAETRQFRRARDGFPLSLDAFEPEERHNTFFAARLPSAAMAQRGQSIIAPHLGEHIRNVAAVLMFDHVGPRLCLSIVNPGCFATRLERWSVCYTALILPQSMRQTPLELHQK
jgi:hypothetical protein